MKYIKIILDNIYNIKNHLKDGSVDTIITSPPYWTRRKYKDAKGQLGNEDTLEEYIDVMALKIGQLMYDVLSPTGSYFLNIGRSYIDGECSFILEKIALKMRDIGWKIKDMIMWRKINPMPISDERRWTMAYEPIIWAVKDTSKHSFFFPRIAEKHCEATIRRYLKDEEKRKALGLKKMYHETTKYQGNEILGVINGGDQYGKCMTINPERGKMPHNVWETRGGGTRVPHPAPFPVDLPEKAILATCPTDGLVLDPFIGSGSTAVAALRWGFNCVGFELSEPYFKYCIMDRLRWYRKRLDYKFMVVRPNG